jgi:hypothetical protein
MQWHALSVADVEPGEAGGTAVIIVAVAGGGTSWSGRMAALAAAAAPGGGSGGGGKGASLTVDVEGPYPEGAGRGSVPAARLAAGGRAVFVAGGNTVVEAISVMQHLPPPPTAAGGAAGGGAHLVWMCRSAALAGAMAPALRRLAAALGARVDVYTPAPIASKAAAASLPGVGGAARGKPAAFAGKTLAG